MYLIDFCTAGVAFTKHLIQLYSYAGSNDLRQHSQVS